MTLLKGKKVLIFDLETSYNTIADFSLGYNKTINHHQILRERQIICAGYKWLHDKETHTLDWGLQKQDDKSLVKKLAKILSGADMVVTQNGDSFDIKWLKTRALIHGLEPLPPITSIDTLKLNRKNFYFNSNKLDYLSKLLGFGGKNSMCFSDWVDVVEHKKRKALNKMLKYVKKDVLDTENLFKKIAPYVILPTSVSHPSSVSVSRCKQCDGGNLINDGFYYFKSSKRKRYRCKDCRAVTLGSVYVYDNEQR